MQRQSSAHASLKEGESLEHRCLVLAYLLPAAFLGCPQELQDWLSWNATCQMVLFLPVVILPALVTGHMFYVDVGWPTGLALIGANGLLNGSGFWLRRWLMGGCMMLHGGRMAFGALVVFFPYRRADDLPRYKYAKLRWAAEGMRCPQDAAHRCEALVDPSDADRDAGTKILDSKTDR